MGIDGIVQKKEWVGKLSIPFFCKKKDCPGRAGPRGAQTEKCKKNTFEKIKKVLKNP